MITLSIDVTKLDRDRFIKGKKGTYCNLVLIETPNSEYGDFMVKQDMSKEDRESGVQMPILGNAKKREPKQSFNAPRPSTPSPRATDIDDEPIPF